MDIDILLAFQSLREAAGDSFTQFILFVTGIPLSPWVFLFPLAFYWIFDKAAGQLSILSYGITLGTNLFVKNTVCCERPFNRDTRITPPEEALPTASGYSFPSGHSQFTASIFLSIGWRWRAKKWLFALTIAFTLLIMFTRLYLCVHTPQDVICGCALGILSIFLASLLVKYLAREDAKPTRVFVIGLIIGVVLFLYVYFKPYPGEERNDTIIMISALSTLLSYFGILIGWYLEQRFVNFSTDVPVRDKLIRTAISLVLTIVAYNLGGWLFGMLNFMLASTMPTFCGAVVALWAGPAISELVIAKLNG